MIGMDDSKSNRDIVEMIKKIALAIEKKNTQDLRNIAEELESWEPRGNWDDMDVRTKVFVEHLLVGLARIQLGLDVLDKGANELTEIRQEVEEKEMNDAILDSFDDEDYAGFDFVCFKCGLRKIGKAELEDSVGNKMCGRCARALGGKNTSDLMTKLDELKRENVDLAQKITTENLDRFCKRDLDNVDEALLATEIKNATYEGISEKDLAESMLMTARTMVEKEPNYSYVTARLLLNNMENEVCGFLNIKERKDRAKMYMEALTKTVDKGIELDFLSEELKTFDLEKLGAALLERGISNLHI